MILFKGFVVIHASNNKCAIGSGKYSGEHTKGVVATAILNIPFGEANRHLSSRLKFGDDRMSFKFFFGIFKICFTYYI